MSPRRIRLSRAKGWRLPPNTVVVTRPGPWGNPFVVGTHGTAQQCVDLHRYLLRGWVCLSKGNAAGQQAHYQHVGAYLGDLAGKNLACWCALDKPCHADTLLEAAAAGTTIHLALPRPLKDVLA